MTANANMDSQLIERLHTVQQQLSYASMELASLAMHPLLRSGRNDIFENVRDALFAVSSIIRMTIVTLEKVCP